MSKYLVERIRRTENITVRTNHTVSGVEGEGHLQWITVVNTKTGETARVPADGLFVFIGATPRTEWLADAVARDEHGFVHAGCDSIGDRPAGWPLDRQPYALETTTPGVFVAGDVRRGSVKRITAAAGEGAMAVHFIQRYCRDAIASRLPSPGGQLG